MSNPPQDPMRARKLRMSRTIAALVLREMATTHGRSPGGYLWAVVEPVAALGVLTAVFSLVLRSPSLGTSFPLFYATGYLPFMMFNEISGKIAGSIRFSKPLLTYPSVTFVDALLARLLLTLLTHVMISYLIFSGLILFTDTRTILTVPPILVAFSMATMFGLGVGTLNCYLMTSFPAWERVWHILTRPLFLISCIFFTFENVPSMAQKFLWFNPLTHISGEMRRGFYANYTPNYISITYVMAVSLVCLVLGLALLLNNYRALVND